MAQKYLRGCGCIAMLGCVQNSRGGEGRNLRRWRYPFRSSLKNVKYGLGFENGSVVRSIILFVRNTEPKLSSIAECNVVKSE